MNENRCVCCGKVIPEGSQVCVICGYKVRKEKPKFIEHIQLSVPKIADMGEFKIGMEINTQILPVKDLDDAICVEIIKMAKEKGINDLYLLNKRAIVSALEKQIPKKPTPHTVEPIEAPIKIGNVNWCKGTTIYHCPNCKDFISRVYTYCHKCGQALDWSDTE